MLDAMKVVLFFGLVILAGLAQATGINYRLEGDSVIVTFVNVDSPDGPPSAGALHCVTGTRRQWASYDGGRTFHLNQMIGGCVDPRGASTVVHAIDRRAAYRDGTLCLIPVFVDRSGQFLAWSSHPDGPTQLTARSGGMITALNVRNSTVRAATSEEAYGCD